MKINRQLGVVDDFGLIIQEFRVETWSILCIYMPLKLGLRRSNVRRFVLFHLHTRFSFQVNTAGNGEFRSIKLGSPIKSRIHIE